MLHYFFHVWPMVSKLVLLVKETLSSMISLQLRLCTLDSPMLDGIQGHRFIFTLAELGLKNNFVKAFCFKLKKWSFKNIGTFQTVFLQNRLSTTYVHSYLYTKYILDNAVPILKWMWLNASKLQKFQRSSI